MCPNCDRYDTVVDIHGPAQLRRIVEKIRSAVLGGQLGVDDEYTQRVDALQPRFLELNLKVPGPDGIHYRFHCARCGQPFELYCELYHGAGGKWRPFEQDR